jgi:hypothetical protein
VFFLMTGYRYLSFLTFQTSSQLPILNGIELELTVEQVFGWLTLS